MFDSPPQTENVWGIWQVFFLGQYETPSESRLGPPPKYEKRDFEGGKRAPQAKILGFRDTKNAILKGETRF